MKNLILLSLFISGYCISSAQDSAIVFPSAEFSVQLERVICAAKNDFSELAGKTIIKGSDTTWRSNIALPGFKYSNLGKGKSMIDYAFVAFQPFTNAQSAEQYYEEVKKAINNLPGSCFKVLQGGIPTVVQGVVKFDVWKSNNTSGYGKSPNTLVNVSLSLDQENEVVINVFLK